MIEKIEKQDYFETLKKYENRRVTLEQPVQGSGGNDAYLKIRGTLSKGCFYYEVQSFGKRIEVIPGREGLLHVGKIVIDLLDLKLP